VSAWTDIFLGIIALATLVMAAVQVLIISYAARLGRQVERLTRQVEDDIKPLLANLTAVSRDATRASSLAIAQIERVDHLVADVMRRVDETVTIVQQLIIAPAREGRAVLSAVAAVIAAFRGFTGGDERRGPRSSRVEDEDPLFIG
jgi:hypothetical protein